jgi:HEAT repeat protein
VPGDLLEGLFSGDDERAQAAVDALAQLVEPVQAALQEQLCKGLASGEMDADQRWWALRALAELPADPSRQTLLQALLDPDPGVRQCAALGLRKTPHIEALPALLAALDDPDPLCADLAADTLLELGAPAQAALREVVCNGSEIARMRSQRALERFTLPARPTATIRAS